MLETRTNAARMVKMHISRSETYFQMPVFDMLCWVSMLARHSDAFACVAVEHGFQCMQEHDSHFLLFR